MGCTSSQPVPVPPTKHADKSPAAASAPISVADIETVLVAHAPEIEAVAKAAVLSFFGGDVPAEGEGGSTEVEEKKGRKVSTVSNSPSILADVGSIASSAAAGQAPSLGALSRVGAVAAKAALSAAKNATSQDSPLNPGPDTIGSYDPSDVEGDGDGDDAEDSPALDGEAEGETNITRPSVFIGDVPLMRYGQLRKQSAGMLVKNWRRRNFTAEKGIVRYYELFLPHHPFGDREKGCLSLRGYIVVSNSNTSNTGTTTSSSTASASASGPAPDSPATVTNAGNAPASQSQPSPSQPSPSQPSVSQLSQSQSLSQSVGASLGPRQVLLKSSQSSSKDLLLECGDAAKRAAWVEIFREHAAYADRHQVDVEVAGAGAGAGGAKKSPTPYKVSTRF